MSAPILPLAVIFAAGPCKKQYSLVARLWPDGIPLTPDAMALARAEGVDVACAKKLLPDEARAELSRVTGPALAEYDRAGGPVHAELCRVTGKARAEYNRATDVAIAWAEFVRVRDAAHSEYLRVTATARAELDRALAAALLAGLLATFGGGE